VFQDGSVGAIPSAPPVPLRDGPARGRRAAAGVGRRPPPPRPPTGDGPPRPEGRGPARVLPRPDRRRGPRGTATDRGAEAPRPSRPPRGRPPAGRAGAGPLRILGGGSATGRSDRGPRTRRPARPRPTAGRGSPEGIRSDPLASNASLPTISGAFDSLLRVLFIFPSRYLFAIGLSPVFSFGWDPPPASGCAPGQPDSGAARRSPEGGGTGLRLPGPDAHGALTLRGTPFQGISRPGPVPATDRLETTIRPVADGRADYGPELSPLRSPLPRGSPLVSSPPLNDMLKFGG